MKHTRKERISWSGIIAGLVVGMVALISALALGTAVTAITGLDVFGSGILATIWVLISLIASAYVSGVVAMLVNKPYSEILEVEMEEDEIETHLHKYRKNAKITGLITGSLIVLLSTFGATNGISSILSGAMNAAGGTGAALGTATYTQNENLSRFINDISREDIEAFITNEVDNLNREQIDATADVILNSYRNTRSDLENVSLANLKPTLKERYENLTTNFSGENFVNRLEAQGLERAEAVEVQNTAKAYVNELEEGVEEVIDTARMTIATSALLYLLYIAVIIGSTILGAKSVKHTKEELEEEETKTSKK